MRKKLFTIIMSVMMVAVFMPSMAFATTTVVPHVPTSGAGQHAEFELANVQYNADYTKATADVVCSFVGCDYKAFSVSTDTVKTFNETSGEVDVKATFDKDAIDAQLQQLQGEYHLIEGVIFTTSYYDFTNATLVGPEASALKLNRHAYEEALAKYDRKAWKPGADAATLLEEFSKDVVEALGGSVYVQFVEPEALRAARVAGIEETTYLAPTDPSRKALTAEVSASDKLSVTPKETPEKFLTESMTLSFAYAPQGLYVGTPSFNVVVGLLTKDGTDAAFGDYDVEDFFTVNGETLDTADSVNHFTYDGKALEFASVYSDVEVLYTTDELPRQGRGTVAEPVWSLTPPTIKDVKEHDGQYKFSVKVQYKNAINEEYETLEPETFLVEMDPATISLKFKQSSFDFGDHFAALVTPSDVMSVEGFADCDKETAAKYFDQYLTIDGLNATYGDRILTYTQDVHQFVTDYLANKDVVMYQFDLNYNLLQGDADNQTARLYVYPAYANPVKQTIAKINAKKNVKKTVQLKVARGAKGALTWKKLSGNSKVTVSKDGKLVVKKGLKKGTYKVKVSVTAAGDQLYLAKTATRTLKVVVK